tara:strand:+ start:333 stop:599 length:267 start_codon:yes stop_codon:yes gene_type:complete
MISKFNIDMSVDFNSGTVTIHKDGENHSKYMINNLHTDSVLLDILRDDIDKTDKSVLKIAHPDIYKKLFIDIPATQAMILKLVEGNKV